MSIRCHPFSAPFSNQRKRQPDYTLQSNTPIRPQILRVHSSPNSRQGSDSTCYGKPLILVTFSFFFLCRYRRQFPRSLDFNVIFLFNVIRIYRATKEKRLQFAVTISSSMVLIGFSCCFRSQRRWIKQSNKPKDSQTLVVSKVPWKRAMRRH